MDSLHRIRIILVNTSHPGNIGSVARAMKTMGLCQLYLVAPKQFPHEKATALASNADDLLTQATVVSTVEEAVAGCGLILGTSARLRSLPWPLLTPREAAAKTISQVGQAEVAIVFGREDAGLTNEELQLCHAHICIPGNEAYNVLNLAQAVQIVTYECRMAALSDNPLPNYQEKLAKSTDVQALFIHIEQLLKSMAFHHPSTSKKLMPRIKRLFMRVELEKREVSILRGICSAIEREIQ